MFNRRIFFEKKMNNHFYFNENINDKKKNTYKI